eukprot:8224952-Prorocentrum_lima.AAC.1
MTSSLVGSEMCIRDSHEAAAPGGAAPSQGSPAPHSAVGDADTDPSVRQPVSYTHLTLPTICSV